MSLRADWPIEQETRLMFLSLQDLGPPLTLVNFRLAEVNQDQGRAQPADAIVVPAGEVLPWKEAHLRPLMLRLTAVLIAEATHMM